MPSSIPSQTLAACPRCTSALGADRRRATALDGGTVCEPCQHQELDELIEELERTGTGPAVPANSIPLESRARLARSGA
jgi:hypothetical protein